MKKILILLLTCLMIISLSACSNKNETNNQEANANLANPVKELSSLDELSKEIEMALYKYEGSDISDEHYRLIDGEYKIGEYEVRVGDLTYVVRVSKAPCSIDISGIYFDGNQLYSAYLKDEGTVYIENDDYVSVRWFNLDGQYVIFVETDSIDYNTFNDFTKPTQDVKPLSWNSDVAYEDYLKICGYYFSENNEIASISIKEDHALLVVTTSKGEGNVTYEMNAVLKGDELVYEEGKVSYFEYDYEKNESIEETLPSIGAGSVTVKDGVVSFENSGIVELTNSTMEYFEF